MTTRTTDRNTEDPPVEDATTSPDGSDGAAAASTAPAASSGRSRLPWLVAGVAATLAVAFGVLWWQADGRATDLEAAESARSEVAIAARQVIIDLTTWDAGDGLDEEISALRAQGTGPFLDEIETQFTAETGAQLEQLEIASTGEIEEVFVVEIEGETAQAFVIVTHTYLLPSGPDTPLVRPATVQLRRVDGQWRVQSVDLPPPDAELAGMMNQLEVGQ